MNMEKLNYQEQLRVVKENGMLLEGIRYQTVGLCEAAVIQNGMSLQFVKKQTKFICKLAIEQNNESIKFVKDYMLKEDLMR